METRILLTTNKHAYARMKDGIFEVRIPKWMPTSKHAEIIKALYAKYPKDRPVKKSVFQIAKEKGQLPWAYGQMEHVDDKLRSLSEREFRRYILKLTKERFLPQLEAELERFSLSMKAKQPITKVLIKDLKSRWGSCTPNGHITISLALFLVPYPLFEYVCAHEVAHLTHLHHGPSFWKHLQNEMPDARQRRKHLHHFHIG